MRANGPQSVTVRTDVRMRIAQVRTFVIRPTQMHTEGEVRTADYVHAQACAVRADLWNPSLTQSERNVSPITTVEGVAN